MKKNKKAVRHASKWLDNVDMHTHAKFVQNVSCGSRVITIYTNW